MAFLADAPIDEGIHPPSIDERRALIERVAGSAQLRRSARLRDFLLYVGGQSLKEGCPEIHEQEIGARVFGRSSTYDRSQDNIVRVNATELRKRIELYFSTEGRDETLVLEIPRGGYKPIFHRRVPGTELETVSPSASLPPRAPFPHTAAISTGIRRSHIIWAALTLALTATSFVLFQQNRQLRKALNPWEGKPAVAAFWSGFLAANQQTDLVLPDDSLSVTEDLVRRPVSLEDYLNRHFMREIQSSNLSTDRKADLDQLSSHNLVTFGGVRATQIMLGRIPLSSPTNLTLARYYVADSLKRNNVIFVGGKKSNPWVHLFDRELNFVTDYDDAHSQAFVANRHPNPGEQAIYPVSTDADTLTGYSTIAFLPNPSGTGNVIILAGTDSDATCAAAEFLTSNDDLLHLQKVLGSGPNSFPYFEVLLSISRLSGTSFNSRLLAYRTYPKSN